ncbi:MAG: hypothetical protein QOD32_3139 [Pyrinomonadaceae bacterium]|jgi:hypothetical protein|nr:hypothetical protein [Pyrinomonadaceae bacterium]MDQ1590411.1 hypothetical protein [Pyrinomonadaceae bacterium]
MSQVRDGHFGARRRTTERGNSRLNFLIVIVVIAAVAYAGYQYVPVAYQASQLKVFMQDTVNNAVITDKDARWADDQLRRNLTSYGAPPDARINVANSAGRIEAHVEYTVPVPLLVTTYEYKFDHTVRSNNLLPGGGG